MNINQQGFFKLLSELPVKYLDTLSESQVSDGQSFLNTAIVEPTPEESLSENIKAAIREADKPLYAREIKDSLSRRGINSVSVDTVCGRMRRSGELMFFPDSADSIRGRYGLPGQTVEMPVEQKRDLVLIQDLADEQEIVRLDSFHIYRRPSPITEAVYFAPYFTRRSGKQEGVSGIYKVVGSLYFRPAEWESWLDEIRTIAPTQQIFDTWRQGLEYAVESGREEPFAHYFLRPMTITFEMPLLKDPGRTEGAGVDWITLMIPANRTVTLENLFSRIPLD